MATQNSINANASTPLITTDGGTGLSNPTAHGILVGEGASAVNPIVLTNGQLLVGSTGADPVAASITAGTGISVTPGAGTITIASTGGGGFTWNNVTVNAPVTMVAAHGYIQNSAGTNLDFILPSTSAVGDVVAVADGGLGFQITQAAGQYIEFGNVTTTVGTGGSITSISGQNCAIQLLCIQANIAWVVISSVSNFTVV
jgi:hypothetical protein